MKPPTITRLILSCLLLFSGVSTIPMICAQIGDLLGDSYGGYTTAVPLAQGLADLRKLGEEHDRAALSHVTEAEIRCGLIDYCSVKPAQMYRSECLKIVSSQQLPKGTKLDFERRSRVINIGSEIGSIEYLDVYLYIGIDRDTVPLAQGGKWRKILLRSIPLSVAISGGTR